MNMQVIVDQPTAFHVKVAYNGEYRRFALHTCVFEELEETIQTLYNLGRVPIKIKFQDDENDWVLLSSSTELKYAFELSGMPLRLSVQVGEKPNCSQESADDSASPEPGVNTIETPDISSRVRGAGRGRGRGRGKMNAGVPPMQERLATKCNRLSDRIAQVEARLANPALTSDRERVLRWRLVNLQEKLQAAKDKRENLESALKEEIPEPSQIPKEAKPALGEGRRGRGGRGRGRGRMARSMEQTPSIDASSPRDALQKFREAKVALKIVRKSGNAEAIAAAEEAVQIAQEAKKNSLFVALAAQRAHKRECTIKLKEAQKSCDEEQVKICEEALAKALHELRQAKLELLQ